MLISMFILFQIFMIGFFVTAFFTKNEILWAVSFVFSGMLMVASYNVEVMHELATNVKIVSYTLPYLMGINLLFFVLTAILGLMDFYDKYSTGVE